MKIIGVTGGVGAGKSEILSWLEKNTNCKVVRADDVAHLLMKPGQVTHSRLVSLLNSDVVARDGSIDRRKMGEKVFNNRELLNSVNRIVHPAVKEYLLSDMDHERRLDRFDYYFLEAALLIEDGYDRICEELWYIHTDENVRRERLKRSRGYTDSQITGIMNNQADDGIFRRYSSRIIDNSGELSETIKQLRKILGMDICTAKSPLSSGNGAYSEEAVSKKTASEETGVEEREGEETKVEENN